MKLVVLDGYALNPGDLHWEGLSALGELTVYDRTPEDKILERTKEAEIIFTNKTPLSGETLKALPKARYIGFLATGYNVADVKTAGELGILVTNVPTYGTPTVAQMVFALLLELCHHVQRHDDAVKGGRWSKNPDYSFWDYPLIELDGKTMGIIGFGRIGRRVARAAHGFGMKVIASDPHHVDPPDYPGFEWAGTEELLSRSDVVSLNVLLTDETEGMINTRTISLMKPTAFLINASRGGLVKDEELAEALNKGVIAGAALDVVSHKEPPDPKNPLLYARNVIITPHIAWAAFEARARLMDTAVDNVKAFLDGSPQNVVNSEFLKDNG